MPCIALPCKLMCVCPFGCVCVLPQGCGLATPYELGNELRASERMHRMLTSSAAARP
jgi:hypothetical protein